MERVSVDGQEFLAVVDYAHTPDAVETALKALRPVTEGKLRIVVGCGGDRDRAKRPLMGAAAVRLADEAVFTDDNPRSENSADILAAVTAGAEAECTGTRCDGGGPGGRPEAAGTAGHTGTAGDAGHGATVGDENAENAGSAGAGSAEAGNGDNDDNGDAGRAALGAPTYRVIADRAEAIAYAVSRSGPGDVLIVAGKGHEQGQETAGVIRPFDDRVVLRAALEAARGACR
jgi:UDP-N-acetylmuramoyl-L-alanyl-D-glutamate--2,6-diaminopimelate ligase